MRVNSGENGQIPARG